MLRIVEHPVATDVLGRADFSVVPYRDRYSALAERLGLDFGGILFALDHIPLCLDGPEHSAQRADVARLIVERKAIVTEALPGIVEAGFAPLAVHGDHDLVDEVVLPCVDGLISTMVGVDLNLGRDSLVSRIFSQSMGVARRRRLEREVTEMIESIRVAHPGDSPLRLGSRIALSILGRDALTGTLALSLNHILERAGGRRLNELSHSAFPTHTGVPYIDRQARCPVRVDGADVARGEVLRCLLQSLEIEDEAARLRFFGAGMHVCLGRPVTLDLFEQVAARLSSLPVRVAVTELRLRDDDVFACPDEMIVRVSS